MEGGLERRVPPTALEEAKQVERLSQEKASITEHMQWLQVNLENMKGNLSAMRYAYDKSIEQVKDLGPESEEGKKLFGNLTAINEELKKLEGIRAGMEIEIEEYKAMQDELTDSIRPHLN